MSSMDSVSVSLFIYCCSAAYSGYYPTMINLMATAISVFFFKLAIEKLVFNDE